MAIVNFNNCGGTPKQLYRIRYHPFPAEEEAELYVLAYDYETALDLFRPFYHTRQDNPREIPSDVSEEDGGRAIDAVRGIDRIADVVLALK